jgi:hypothetical protein
MKNRVKQKPPLTTTKYKHNYILSPTIATTKAHKSIDHKYIYYLMPPTSPFLLGYLQGNHSKSYWKVLRTVTFCTT